MSRLGYECDGCGEEHRRVGPAAVVRDNRGRMERELCSSCYDDHDSGGTSDPEEIKRAQENLGIGDFSEGDRDA